MNECNENLTNLDAFTILIKKKVQTTMEKMSEQLQYLFVKAEAIANESSRILQNYQDKSTKLTLDIENFYKEKSLFETAKEEWNDQVQYIKEQNAIQEEKIKLDIGGYQFSSSMAALTSGKCSFFDKIFSGAWALKRDEEGCIFIDRDGSVYHYILNYLRDEKKVVLPDDKYNLSQLEKECEFLGCDDLLQQIKLNQLKNLESGIVSMYY